MQKLLLFAKKKSHDFATSASPARASARVAKGHASGVVNLQLATRHAWYAYTAAPFMPCICGKLMRCKNKVLTYMKLAGIKQGFLINFNVRLLKDGLKSFVL